VHDFLSLAYFRVAFLFPLAAATPGLLTHSDWEKWDGSARSGYEMLATLGTDSTALLESHAATASCYYARSDDEVMSSVETICVKHFIRNLLS
jgi:hypothetical protein